MKSSIKLSALLMFTLFFGTAYADQAQTACSSDNHKSFDFWVGEWVVHNVDGSLAGNNSIQKTQKGCVVQENWTSAEGNFTGTSLNFYHKEKKQWQQIWLDSSGANLELKGNRIGKQMILRTDSAKNKDGKVYFHKITWTKNDDGSVRQLWETITGDEVSIVFDGLYTKG